MPRPLTAVAGRVDRARRESLFLLLLFFFVTTLIILFFVVVIFIFAFLGVLSGLAANRVANAITQVIGAQLGQLRMKDNELVSRLEVIYLSGRRKGQWLP